MYFDLLLFALNLRIRLRFTMKPSQHLLKLTAEKDELNLRVSRWRGFMRL